MIILWKQKKDVLFLEGKYLFDGRKIKYVLVARTSPLVIRTQRMKHQYLTFKKKLDKTNVVSF